MKRNLNYFFEKHSFLVLILLIILAGLFSMYKFFSAENLFFFTGLADDSCALTMVDIMSEARMTETNFDSNYSFSAGMGDGVFQHIPADPINFINYWIKKLIITIGGESSLSVGYFYLKFLFSFLGAGIFTFLWLRTLNVSKFSSLIGGLTMAFSSCIVVLSPWNIEIFGFYLAFYLFAFEQLLLKHRFYFFPFAVALLATSPYHLYLYSLFLFIYMIFRFFVIKIKFKNLFFILLQVFCLGIIGLLISCPDLIHSLHIQMSAPRISGNVGFANYASSNLLISNEMWTVSLLRLFAHNIPGNDFAVSEWNNYLEAPALYCGLLTLIVFPQIFTHLNSSKKIIYSVFILFWISVLIFPPLRRSIVLFAGDYYRYGIDFFFAFTMILISSQSLSIIEKTNKINIPLLSFSIVFCFVALYGAVNSEAAFVYNINNTIVYFSIFIMIVYALLLFFYKNFSNRQVAKISIVCLLLIEVSVLTFSAFNNRDSVSKLTYDLNRNGLHDGTEKIVDKIKKSDTSSFYRIEKDYKSNQMLHSSLNESQPLGYFGTKRYNSFNQPYYVKYLENIGNIAPYIESETRWVSGVSKDPFDLSFVGIKYYLTKNDTISFSSPLFSKIDNLNGISVYNYKNPLPLGFTLDKYIDSKSFNNLIYFKLDSLTISNFKTSLMSMNISVDDRFEINLAIDKLKGKTFNNVDSLYSTIKQISNIPNWLILAQNLFHTSIYNFDAKQALFSTFVYEPNSDIDTTKYSKFDINEIIPLEKFTYNAFDTIYQHSIAEKFDITEFKNDNICGTINVSRDKFLVLTIPYDKGWKAILDGNETQLKCCNFGLSGLEIPQGNHKLELSFSQPYKNISILVSWLTMLIVCGFLIFIFIYKKKHNLSY
ncbi:MAG: YfhO family protein [Bacteroidales bacterium]|nr:YfhO family protein [Bacteroidales bacterium]